MKLRNLILAAVLLPFSFVSVAEAQSLTTLYSFTALDNNTNSDGASPFAGLVLLGDTLYGTAYLGGNSGNGTVFAVSTNSVFFTNLYNFTDGNDGANPDSVLALSGNTLYGTADAGGSLGSGTVFAVNTSGTIFSNLYSFTNGSDGATPQAGLILTGNTLYGTASDGGSSNGTVFATGINGLSFTNVYSFTNGSDGSYPFAGLVSASNKLYGTAYLGGSSNYGTVFVVNTNGIGFTNLHSFTNGTDGAYPEAQLVLSGNALYGTTSDIDFITSVGFGTVFKVNTDGTGFTNLYNFTAVSGFQNTNNDGANPVAGLILGGNTLYGTAEYGGSSGYGTIFAISTTGTGFTNLYNFTGGNDGANPEAQLILSGSVLYGTTANGGRWGSGTVFALNLAGSPPVPTPLNVQLSGNNVILSWTDPSGAFFLQTAPTVTGMFTNVPGAINPYTNTITGTRRFFRLKASY